MNLPSLDTVLLFAINRGMANPFFDLLMPLLSYQGYLLVVPLLFHILYCGYQRKDPTGKRYLVDAIFVIAIACLSVYVCDQIEHPMKNAIGRVRPCRAIDGIRLIIPCPKSPSMPSGHALSSFAFALPLFYLTRKFLSRAWRWYPMVLAALIVFSRTYLGVHYPSDLLVGGLIGAAIGMLLSLSYGFIAGKLTSKGNIQEMR